MDNAGDEMLVQDFANIRCFKTSWNGYLQNSNTNQDRPILRKTRKQTTFDRSILTLKFIVFNTDC